jgi:acyl carrier protein
VASRNEIKQMMATFLNHKIEKIKEEVILKDLVTESHVLVDMVLDLQEDLGIHLIQEDIANVKTVGDLLNVLEKKTKK